MNVTKGSSILDELMVAPPKYALWKMVIIGGLASAAIVPSGKLFPTLFISKGLLMLLDRTAFYGSFIDMVAVVPLGGLLVMVQVLLARNDLYSSLFE